MPKLSMQHERIVVGQLWLQLFLKSGFFDHLERPPARPLLDTCLIIAVGVADLQGHPMTALKVSRAVSFPRATVIRHLAGLAREGIIVKDERRRFHLAYPLFEKRLPYIKRFIRMVQSASDELRAR
jgi:hypothetical protein